MSSSSLHVQAHRRMVETGEWDSIFAALMEKLNESGWVDELKNYAKEEARRMRPLKFQPLIEELENHAQASIPLAVKQEISTLIRQFLDKQLES